MATYLVENEINLNRQEGDTCDIIFTDVPADINLTGATAIFEVKFNKTTTAIITKTTDDDIVIAGQQITVNLLSTDTKGHSGRWRWELQVTLADTITVITLGKGCLNIIAELIV